LARGAAWTARTGRRPDPTEPSSRDAFSLLLLSFVAAYGIVEAVLSFSLAGTGSFVAAALVLLVFLAVGVFIGSLLELRRALQQFYLALSLLVCVTIARLAFAQVSIPILGPLLAYLLLAATLVVYRPSAEIPSGMHSASRMQLLRAIPLGACLAAAFVILGFVIPFPETSGAEGPILLSVLVLGPAALLDEFWFRGVLQDRLAHIMSARWSWLATAILFVSYGAPFGTLPDLLFRSAYGLTLGALATRRENLPLVLLARTAMAVALVLLNPRLIGSPSIV